MWTTAGIRGRLSATGGASSHGRGSTCLSDGQPTPPNLPLYSWPSIDVPPVEGNESIRIDGATATPPQPVRKHDAAPRHFQKVAYGYAEGDIDARRRAASVGTTIVRGGGSPLSSELSLLITRTPP